MKTLQTFKKIKGANLLPPPYYNYLDDKNFEFLQYAKYVPSIRAELNQEIVACDYKSILPQVQKDDENPLLKDIAFVGRSNVGKSSLVNYVSGLQVAKTSKTPGKTRDLSFVSIGGHRRIIDCPGYGFARASQTEKDQWRKLMEVYLNKASSLHRVLLLIDLSAGVQDSDKMLLDMLIEQQKTVSLVLTKVDKVKSQHVQGEMQKVIQTVQAGGLILTMSPIVHLVSSYTGYGLHELMCGLCQTYSQDKMQQQQHK